jgi:hypothetical protein
MSLSVSCCPGSVKNRAILRSGLAAENMTRYVCCTRCWGVGGHAGGWRTRSRAPAGRKKKSPPPSVASSKFEESLIRKGHTKTLFISARAIRRPCLSREGTNEDPIRTRAWAWRPAATAFPPLQLHALPSRHPPPHRSGFARDRPGLGRVVTCHSAAGMLLLKHPQRPAAGSIPAQADARQGLLHGRALLPSQDLEEVRRASCHCILLP